MSKVWLITGAGRGLGVDIANAALAAGHNVVATGRNTDRVARALGKSANLLVVKLDITKPSDAESAVKADGTSALHESCRPDECHPRRPSGYAKAAFWPDNHNLLNCGPDRV